MGEINITPEIIGNLRIFFNTRNLYIPSTKKDDQSKKSFRGSNNQYWNRQCVSLVNLNLAEYVKISDVEYIRINLNGQKALLETENEIINHRYYSLYQKNEFTEIRESILKAADNTTKSIIEKYWKESFINNGKQFSIGFSFEYLIGRFDSLRNS